MKAVLLAAGLGTRLSPITQRLPKCLVPIDGKPLLEYWLEQLTSIGIKDILINTHYLHKQVEAFIETSSFKPYVTLVHEETLLNTGGTLLANRDFFAEETFMVIHADNLCFCDFQAFMKTHKERPIQTEMTMMLFHTSDPSSCGVVLRDEQNIVQAFYEKVEDPPSSLANAAIYLFEPSLFEELSSINSSTVDLSLDILPRLLGKIHTYINKEYLQDIGTIQRYATAQIDMYTRRQRDGTR